MNANGATLKDTVALQGFDLRSYTGVDSDTDNIVETYTMSFTVAGIASGSTGSLVLVSPSGIDKAKITP